VHRKCIPKYDQQDATLHSFFYFCKLSYMFRVSTLPRKRQVAVTVWQIPVAVDTVLSSWWLVGDPPAKCTAVYRKKNCVMLHLVGYTSTLEYKQCKYKLFIEARSCNHCCTGKAISIKNCECVCVRACARLIYAACNATVPYFIVTCGLSGSTKFFHIIS